MSEVARSARQVSRTLDSLVAATKTPIEEGIPLSALGNKDAAGRLIFQTQAVTGTLPDSLPAGKADNQILGVVRGLKDLQTTRDVVLVSKDINMRVKARVLGLQAEDYTNDKVLEDTDLLYTGVLQLPASFWDKNGKGMESWQHAGFTSTGSMGRSSLGCWSISSSISKTGPLLCAGARDSRQVAVLRVCCATTHTPRTPCGSDCAQP